MKKHFIQRVRRREVKILPTHVGRFNKEDWKAAYEASASPDESDRRLYVSGLWINSRIQWVSDEAAKIPFPSQKIERAVRLHVGLVNRETAGIRLMSLETGQGDLMIAEQVVAGRFESPSFGYSATPADIHEAATDGLKIALDSLRQKAERPSNISTTQTQTSADSELQKVVAHLNCGVLFDVFVDLWNAFLWEGRHVRSENGLDIIMPSDASFDVTSAASRFRADRLLTEVVTAACRLWTNELFAPLQQELAQRKKVFVNEIERVGKRKKLRFGPAKLSPESPPKWLLSRTVMDELYYVGLADVPFPLYPGVTLSLLMEAWSGLAEFGELLARGLPQRDTLKNSQQIYEYCPTVAKSELVELLAVSTPCKPEFARILLAFFLNSAIEKPQGPTSESLQEDVWTSPFLELSEGRIAVVVDALTNANLVRSAEHWMKKGGLKLSVKGTEFESHVRARISKAIADSLLRDISGVIGESVDVAFAEGKEQFDLIIWIGNTVILGEIKCILFPSSPHQRFNYRQTVEDGVDQIRRKAARAGRDLAALLAKMPKAKLDVSAIKLIPVVVVSTPFLAGWVHDNVGVVDERILGHYFSPGHMKRLVLVDRDGNEEVGKIEKFYEGVEDAPRAIESYLLAPPQVKLERASAKFKGRPLPVLGEFRPAHILEPEINIVEPAKYAIATPEDARRMTQEKSSDKED